MTVRLAADSPNWHGSEDGRDRARQVGCITIYVPGVPPVRSKHLQCDDPGSAVFEVPPDEASRIVALLGAGAWTDGSRTPVVCRHQIEID